LFIDIDASPLLDNSAAFGHAHVLRKKGLESWREDADQENAAVEVVSIAIKIDFFYKL